MKAYTQEQEQKILELKKALTTNSDIVKITGGVAVTFPNSDKSV